MSLSTKAKRNINYLTTCLTYSNSCINPFLYTLLTKNYKEYLRKHKRSWTAGSYFTRRSRFQRSPRRSPSSSSQQCTESFMLTHTASLRAHNSSLWGRSNFPWLAFVMLLADGKTKSMKVLPKTFLKHSLVWHWFPAFFHLSPNNYASAAQEPVDALDLAAMLEFSIRGKPGCDRLCDYRWHWFLALWKHGCLEFLLPGMQCKHVCMGQLLLDVYVWNWVSWCNMFNNNKYSIALGNLEGSGCKLDFSNEHFCASGFSENCLLLCGAHSMNKSNSHEPVILFHLYAHREGKQFLCLKKNNSYSLISEVEIDFSLTGKI